MLNFPKELFNRRKAARLSLKTLGAMSGVSDSTISKIEKEESPNLRWDTVCCLTKALNFTDDEFLELAGYPVQEQKKNEHDHTKFSELNDKERKEVDLFIDFLLQRRKLLSSEMED